MEMKLKNDYFYESVILWLLFLHDDVAVHDDDGNDDDNNKWMKTKRNWYVQFESK